MIAIALVLLVSGEPLPRGTPPYQIDTDVPTEVREHRRNLNFTGTRLSFTGRYLCRGHRMRLDLAQDSDGLRVLAWRGADSSADAADLAAWNALISERMKFLTRVEVGCADGPYESVRILGQDENGRASEAAVWFRDGRMGLISW
ncbi:hypothetical protein Q0812_00985 [Brevundimonas sp. 2R-24]|uniref:Uncharacterized protein n=1 Tax=Peiella sedimenti TaxID=3061083 RepID=A0ABT8SHG1_9CAUL|nr:hypothetical protein [Caulobacteraceae bacterium XZ-24]